VSQAETCTSEESLAAVGYLARCFGGFSIPDDETRAFLRLFVKFPPRAVRDAIDELVLRAQRRPSPNDVAQVLRKRQPLPDTRNSEPLPDVSPDDVRRHLDAIRSAVGLRSVTS